MVNKIETKWRSSIEYTYPWFCDYALMYDEYKNKDVIILNVKVHICDDSWKRINNSYLIDIDLWKRLKVCIDEKLDPNYDKHVQVFFLNLLSDDHNKPDTVQYKIPMVKSSLRIMKSFINRIWST